MLAINAKNALIGDMDIDQFIYKSTGTTLSRNNCKYMEPLLKLFGTGIIIIDVVDGPKRAAIGILIPKTKLDLIKPNVDYIVQVADIDPNCDCKIAALSTEEIKELTYPLTAQRTHTLNEFPNLHLTRVAKLTVDKIRFDVTTEIMAVVFIFERLAGSPKLGKIIAWLETLLS